MSPDAVIWHDLECGSYDADLPHWHELARRFSVFTPGVSSAIVGTSRVEHLLKDVAIVSKGPLPLPVRQRICTAFASKSRSWMGHV